jgi:biotin-dependent carboxylase-like uncharacterized protein
MSIEVVKPGALSLFQDSGRYGFQKLGVPVCGPMDESAHRLANLLAGNEADEAVLEITLMGPKLRFAEPAAIALAGADLGARLDGQPLALNRPLVVRPGQVLDFTGGRSGMRGYLAVHGGFDLEPELDSRSTYLKGGLGGMAGRALKAGDVIGLKTGLPADPGFLQEAERRLWEIRLYLPSRLGLLRRDTLQVVKGPHWGLFSEKSTREFVTAGFRISPQSDRMGYRISGPRLAVRKPVQILSEATAFGAVQVPHGGDPIVLMADRQTMGGYPKIAHVVSVDLPSLAQSRPGEHVRFNLVSLEQAQELDGARDAAFAELRAHLAPVRGILSGGSS